MSIVAVHGPNTFGVAGAGGGGGGMTVTSTPAGGGTVTADATNGRKFTLAGAGDRNDPGAYTWSWTPTNAGDSPTSPKTGKNNTVTFGVAGTHTITLAVTATGGTTPPAGSYTFTVVATATAGPRMVEQEAMLPDEDVFDPADYTVTQVIGYVEENPDQLEDVIAAEEAGKNRTTLISQLESMRTA